MPPKAKSSTEVRPPSAPQRTANRRIVEEPVVLSESSVEVGGATFTAQTPPVLPRPEPGPSNVEAGAAVDAKSKDAAPIVPPSPTEPPQAEPTASETVEAAWGVLVADGIKSVETAVRSATAGPSANVSNGPVPVDPDGSIGAPEVRQVTLIGPISPEWPAFPRSVGSFTFDDLVALGRRDARLVHTYTDSDAVWADLVRRRYLKNFWLAYQVPKSLPCDRSMIFDIRDGLYLEGMTQFLTGDRSLPASVDPQFWRFDLPVPSQAGVRTHYDRLRTQWAVSYGFSRVITFPEHDALRVNESPSALYDVVTVATVRQTKYRVPLDRFPALPAWMADLRLPGGLCMQLPRSLLYYGSEVARPERFAAHAQRLAYTVRLETARALTNALELDYRHSQIIWILSVKALDLLEEFTSTPKVTVPAHGDQPACLRGIDDIASACRTARALGDEYIFERVHVPTGEWVRWAFLTPGGFVQAQDFHGPKRGGRSIVGPRRRGSRQADPGHSYVGGFGNMKRSSPEPPASAERGVNLSSLIVDNVVRKAAGLGDLLRDRSVREGGWSIRELLAVALTRVDEAERATRSAEDRIKELEDRLEVANRNVDAWREHSERVARPYPVVPEHREYRRTGTSEARYSDPYAPEAKRTRYEYDEREGVQYHPRGYAPRAPSQGVPGPDTPPVPSGNAPASYPVDPYSQDPPAPQTRHYR